MTLDELKEYISQFLEEHNAAPMFGYRNHKFKCRVEGKGELLNAFCANLQLMACVSDKEVADKIASTIKTMQQNIT